MAEGKLILETFPSLKIQGDDLKEIAEELYVSRACLKKAAGQLHIYVCSDTWIHKKHIRKFENEIKRQLFPKERLSVHIHERFNLSAQYDVRILMDEYKESILYELREYSPVLENIFRNASLEFAQDRLDIYTNGSYIEKERGQELLDIVDKIINERCGLNVICDLKERKRKAAYTGAKPVRTGQEERPQADAYSSAEALSGEAAADGSFAGALQGAAGAISADGTSAEGLTGAGADAQQGAETSSDTAQEAAPEKAGKGRKKKAELPPDVIYGKEFEDEAVKICDLEEDYKYVTIKGQITAVDSRELKSGKILVLFAVTDHTDSIGIKLFSEAEEAGELLGKLKKGSFVKVKGKASEDSFEKELVLMRVVGIRSILPFFETRKDEEPQKRIELHCHTKMSALDAVTDAEALIERAYEWGHKAIAITDHGVVHAFPDANHAVEKLDDKFRKKYAAAHPDADPKEVKKLQAPFKVIYGCEAYIVDDLKPIVENSRGQALDVPTVVFDIETTGFSPLKCRIIEIGAVRVENGRITDHFSTFVDPKVPIPLRITHLTGINDSMVIGSPTVDEALKDFLEFSKGAVLAAHNASFDMSFILRNCEELGLTCDHTYIDTVGMARCLMPKLNNFKLDTIAKNLDIRLQNHHRAVDDAQCTAEIFQKLCILAQTRGINDLDTLNESSRLDARSVKKLHSYHATILVRNETGRRNLYTLVSESHLNYYRMHPLIPKSVYLAHNEGLLIGSACEAGELYQALIRGVSDADLSYIADFYDYYEVMPVGNNEFMINDENNDTVKSVEDIQKLNKQVISLGEKFGKPVVATGDVHFMDPEDELYRRIIQAGQKYEDADRQPPLYFRTTREMLDEFSYIDAEKAREIVIDNPAKIADMCERISPIRAGKFPPVIANSDEDLRESCYSRAREIYGEDLPKVVSDRLEKELHSIISNGYAVMYIIARKLVLHSNEDGYLVGSRGSVGSSLAATMAGITEVNPLSPHYLCRKCHYTDFDSDEVKAYAGRCGFDMPDKKCPVCGEPLDKLGFDIPFETFLGFKGNKEPDIDLNFSGEYQGKAHKYTEVIFGKGQTFKAGTIATLADKTAYGYVMNYFKDREIHKRRAEVDRITAGCTGVRRSTGQHPGGIIVLPIGEDINSFTPVQHPANDQNTDIITTHFDYHSIDQNLLKLDILGHDDPTMIRMLQDITGVDPLKIPLDAPEVMSLFSGTEALGIKPEDIGGCKLGCLGIPEFGTDFVIQMLIDTKPTSFSELVRISGLSHGTNVWLNNAQTLILEGKATLSTAICTRDDIMLYLIGKGMDHELSFTIMESVRKGKGLKPVWEQQMTEAGVPDWYIWSCKRIQYMFPKAHAAAYVMMAYRIAWFKIHEPLAYYAAYFSIRASAFSYELMCMGKEALASVMADYESRMDTLKQKEQDSYKDMKIVREMYARGFEFMPIDLYRSKAKQFQVVDGKILPSFTSIDGLGEVAAESLEAAAKEAKFLSKEDIRTRGKINASIVAKMDELGILGGMSESNQMSIFDF